MTNREFFIERWKPEFAPTVRVLKAVPAGRLDYRPHAKSRSAGELVHLLVALEKAGVDLAEKGEIHWEDPRGFPTLNDMVYSYEQHHRALEKLLANLDDAAWERKAKLYAGGQVAWEANVSAIFWGCLFDAVHHRGQLSVYLRPMGGKVPSIYGPSADDTGQS